MSEWRLRKGGVMLDGPRPLLSLSLSSNFNTTLQTFILLMWSVAVQRRGERRQKTFKRPYKCICTPNRQASDLMSMERREEKRNLNNAYMKARDILLGMASSLSCFFLTSTK